MASAFDFEVYDSRGQLALVVDVKARHHTSTDWAQLTRDRLFADGGVSTTPMFMLVTLDGIYLWKGNAPLRALATYELEAAPIFAPYFERARIDPTPTVDPVVFEMIVESWLSDRSRGTGTSAPILDEAGLNDLLRGARIVAHDTAA